jgi:surface polysaccharide O-acyltransferase-like enzyme
MPENVSRKLTYLQFLCALGIIGLHTVFARHFTTAAPWATDVNRAFRTLFDAATGTFFFLSAMLFYRTAGGKRYGRVLRERCTSLVVPFLLWNAAMLLLTVAQDSLTAGTLTLPTAWDMFRLMVLQPVDSVLWFVQVLLGYIVLYPLILWGVRRGWPAALAFAAALVLNLWKPFPIPYASMLFWLPCYLLGAYLGSRHGSQVFRAPLVPRRWFYPAALAGFAALFALTYAGEAPYYVYWQLAPLCLWVLADPLSTLPAPPWWAAASFYLFCSHLLLERYAAKLYVLALGTGTASFLLANVLLPCLCTWMALLFAALLRRFLPALYGVLTGGRGRLPTRSGRG